jgi:site-specific DNA recombinase
MSKNMENEHADSYLIYCRKSTNDGESQKNSLGHQRMRSLQFADQNKLPIAPLTIARFCEGGIIDERHSGYKMDADFEIGDDGSIRHSVSRPKFLLLIRMLKEKKIKGVIFLSWDRASRNAQDSNLLKSLMKLGCDIRFADAVYDKNSAGSLHMDIDGMFASYYSNTISEKVRNAYKKLHAEGKTTHRSPIGYLDAGSDNKPFDPGRFKLVRRLFELYATGEWSYVQLAKWANQHGLTQKPMRAKRSKKQIEEGYDVSKHEKIARPCTHKTIEYILKNPFYIGKIRVNGEYINSKAHSPLVDTALFNKVQHMLQSRTQSVHYINKPFFTYRGLLRCLCGRIYTPYEAKGRVYYRSNCKEDCGNPDSNTNEEEITAALQELIDQIHFTDEELAEIDSQAKKELGSIAENRNKKLIDLQTKERNHIADLDYLTQNRVSLMRSGGWSPEMVMSEANRLEGLLESVRGEIKAYGESAQEMLKYILTFSELVKNAGFYFKHALDSEKRDIATQIFYEIVYKDKSIESYKAKDGFGALLTRIGLKGGPSRNRTYTIGFGDRCSTTKL